MEDHANTNCIRCLNHLVQALGACCDHDDACATATTEANCCECKRLIVQAIHHCADCTVDTSPEPPASKPTLTDGYGVHPSAAAPADDGSMNSRIGAIAVQCDGGKVGSPLDFIAIIIGIITQLLGNCPAPKKSPAYLASCCKKHPLVTGGRVWSAIWTVCPQMPHAQQKLIFDTIMESGRQATPPNVVQFMQENEVAV